MISTALIFLWRMTHKLLHHKKHSRSYRSKDQLYKQQLSIKCMAQWCHCHDQEENTITRCWEKIDQDGQESTKNTKKQVCNELEAAGRQLSVSTVINMTSTSTWEAVVLERRPCSRRGTLRLNWSFLLITWTKKALWKKTLWSHEKRVTWNTLYCQKYSLTHPINCIHRAL